jgi:hypothetical protein
MADPERRESGVLGDVSRNLGAFFRHLLPGVFIVGAAYIAHPSWFVGVDTKSWEHIAIAGVVALASGNIWFSVNRYGIHQVIDYLVYLAKSGGPAPTSSRLQYLDDLGTYVAKSLSASGISERARQHVAFRASSVLLLYTIAEVGILFTVWHEPATFFARHPIAVTVASVLTFNVGVWQNIITRRIDYHVVRSHEGGAAQQRDGADGRRPG